MTAPSEGIEPLGPHTAKFPTCYATTRKPAAKSSGLSHSESAAPCGMKLGTGRQLLMLFSLGRSVPPLSKLQGLDDLRMRCIDSFTSHAVDVSHRTMIDTLP